MFRVINEEQQLAAIDNRNSLSGHRNEVAKFALSISEARIAEVSKELDEIDYLLKHVEGIDEESDNFARVKLADSGLALLQFIIPQLKQLAERSLEVAGKSAIRTVCGPHYVGGKPIASRYSLPDEYQTVVGKVKSALAR